MAQSKGRYKTRFPLIISSTNEVVKNMREYRKSEHFKNIVAQYENSELKQCCYQCKKYGPHFLFEHRTTIRLGKERLTDISPICFDCFDCSIKNKLRKRGKKKNERFLLSKFSFKPNRLTQGQKDWLLIIHPKQRGYVLTAHYAKIASKYHPSSTWVNAQVKKTCKWIRKKEEEIMQLKLDIV